MNQNLQYSFFSLNFWEEYYKDFNSYYDWYFEIENLPLKSLDFSTIPKDTDILFTGIGNSSSLLII